MTMSSSNLKQLIEDGKFNPRPNEYTYSDILNINKTVLGYSKNTKAHNKILNEEFPENASSQLMVSITDENGIITYIDDDFCKKVGYQRNELIGRNHAILRHPSVKSDFYRLMWKELKENNYWIGLFKNKKKDGGILWTYSVIFGVMEDGRLTRYVGLRYNIHDSAYSAIINGNNSYSDAITGLNNRTCLYDTLKRHTDSGASGYLAMIDVINFSKINEYYGDDAGSELLKKIGLRLSEAFEESQLFRAHGDVFAITCFKSDDIDISRFSKRVSAKIDKVFSSDFIISTRGDCEIKIDVTIGVSSGVDSLIEKASSAIKHAKENNRDHVIYSESISLELEERLDFNRKLSQKLTYGIKNDSIVPYFQPIYDNKKGTIEKFECLARLIDASGKPIPTYELFEAVNRMKKYDYLTRTMISKSFAYFRDKPINFSVNISIKDMINKETMKSIRKELKDFPEPKRITFELLEDENMLLNKDATHSFVRMARRAGAKIAIDDFGAGNANFLYLIELGDIDIVKIDGQIIRNVLKDVRIKMFVEFLVALGRKFNFKTVGEWVENIEIQKELERIGVDYSQGFLFGQAEEEAQLVPLINNLEKENDE